MLRTLSQLSTPAGILLFVCLPAIVSAAAAILVRRRRAIDRLADNNEFAAITYPVIGMIYGVFLAFAIVIVWQRYTDAQDSSYNEVAALSEVWRMTEVFPPGLREPLHDAMRGYVRAVVEKEWPAMTGARADTIQDLEYERLWRVFYAYEPESPAHQIFLDKALDQLNAVGISRRKRLMYSASELDPMLWSFLLFGAAVTIGFSYFLGTKHTWTHALACAALTALIGFSLLLIVSLQYPFTGPASVTTAPYADLLQALPDR